MERRELMFAASGDPGHVFSALSAHFTVVAEAPTTLQWTCLDTADWRLYRAGMTLRHTHRGRTSELVLDADDRPRVAAPTRIGSWPRRIDALPESPVRDLIAPTVGVRALLPLAEVGVRQIPLRLLDDLDKTRVRLRVDQQRLIGSRPSLLPLRVLITPLRGYERDARRCEEVLAAAFAQFGEATHATTVAFRAAGHEPGAPTLVPPTLDPSAPASEEVAKVLRHWATVLDAVRPAVVQDVDIECLREFRSAARSTRALLMLTTRLMPGADLDRFAGEFAWLADLAAPVRAADTLLLQVEGRGPVGISGLDHLDLLADQLHRQRRPPMRALRAGLMSSRSVELVPRWLDAVERLERADVVNTGTASGFARAQVEAAVHQVMIQARGVDPAGPAAELHALRRRLRTLRLVLDTLAPAYAEPATIARLNRVASSLHRRLGAVQDGAVAHAGLTDAASRMAARNVPTGALLTVGALRDRIVVREAAARADVQPLLKKLLSRKTADIVAALAAS